MSLPITISHVGFRYPGADCWTLRDIDLEVKAGEVVKIVGRNGTGKTTLLKLLAGIHPPTEGEIKTNGAVAYMDQTASEMVAPGLTIAEQLKAAGLDGSNQLRTAAAQLRRFEVGLDTRLSEFMGHLSGGQQQIVALLCTLISGARTLCLDEFASALDTRSASVAHAILEDAVASDDVAIVFVAHAEDWFEKSRIHHL